MTDAKPKIIYRHAYDNPLPFPTFVTYAQPLTNEQIKKTERIREADAIFGFYKLNLSVSDQKKMTSYLNLEITAEDLILRFTDVM